MSPELTHEEIESLLGAYALDAVSPAEASLVSDHLGHCDRCAAEVAGHRDLAAILAHSFEEPPAELWSRISDEIASPTEMPASLRRRVDELPEPPRLDMATSDTVVPIGRRADRAARRQWLPAAAAAAVVVLVLLGGVILRQDDRIGDLEDVAAPSMSDLAEAALSDPDARSFELLADDGTSVSAVVDPSGRGFLFAAALPELAADRTYQVWGIAGDHVVSLGVLGASPEVSSFTLPAGVDTVAITDEVAGGVERPSQAPLVAGAVAN